MFYTPVQPLNKPTRWSNTNPPHFYFWDGIEMKLDQGHLGMSDPLKLDF